jgi:hypothetical protein
MFGANYLFFSTVVTWIEKYGNTGLTQDTVYREVGAEKVPFVEEVDPREGQLQGRHQDEGLEVASPELLQPLDQLVPPQRQLQVRGHEGAGPHQITFKGCLHKSL